MEDVKSNEYLEKLRDKVAGDFFVKGMTTEWSDDYLETITKEAEHQGMTLDDYIAFRSIDLANTFVTMLRKHKLTEDEK